MQVNTELKNLIPELTPEEFNTLEASIIKEGIREPIITWQGYIVDGHNRYAIARKHGLEFKSTEREFNSIEDVKLWMIDNQKGRRNLTDGWKFELAQIKKSLLIEKGKENIHKPTGGKAGLTLSNTDKVVNTRNEIANELGWSTGKTAQADYIWSHGDDEVKDKVKGGDVSINQAYTELKKEQKKEERQKQIEEVRNKIETEELEKPSGLFDVIVIDPPWNYGREYDPASSRVANPYPEMNQDELLELEIPAKENSILFLWTTHAFIWDAKELMDSWGYTYKATIVWDKDKIGMGAWFRMQCEFCLVGIKGKPLWNNTTYRDIIKEPRREHSRKPETFYKMVEQITAGKRLDFFSRENREGWEVYGAENGKLA